MGVFLPLAAAFLLIVLLLRKHVPIGACMLAGGLLLWAAKSGDFSALFVELRMSGTLSGMVNALRRVFSSAKALLALMPAFLGLLPSLGGARFSAPIVDELSADIPMPQEHKAAINFWFRHIFEFSSPIIPGMIMACNIAGVPFSAFLKHLSWLTILAFSIGWVIMIRPLRLPDELKPKAEGAQKKRETMDLILALAPVVSTFLLVVFLDMNASLAMGAVTFVLFFVLRATDRFVAVRDTVVGALDKKMLLNVLCILYFIQILTVTGILPEIVAAFQASPLPVPVVIACVSFIRRADGHVAGARRYRDADCRGHGNGQSGFGGRRYGFRRGRANADAHPHVPRRHGGLLPLEFPRHAPPRAARRNHPADHFQHLHMVHDDIETAQNKKAVRLYDAQLFAI